MAFRVAAALVAATIALAVAPAAVAPAVALAAPVPATLAMRSPALASLATTPATEPSPTPPATATPAPVPGAPMWREVGRSVQGRPIEMVSFGDGANHVLILGAVHGTEYGLSVARKLIAYLSANPWAIPAGTRIDVVAAVNPDGVALRRGANADRVDLNRNFPASNWRHIKSRRASSGPFPGSEPETQVLMQLIAEGGYSRIISLHSRGGIVDYDGPGARALAGRLSRISRMPVMRLARIKRYPGSLGSWAPQAYAIPVVTVELRDRRLSARLRDGLLGITQ